MTVLDDFDSLTVEDNLIGYKGNLYQVNYCWQNEPSTFRSMYSGSGYGCAAKIFTVRIYDIFGKENYFQIFSTDIEDSYIMNSVLKTIVKLNIVSSNFYK